MNLRRWVTVAATGAVAAALLGTGTASAGAGDWTSITSPTSPVVSFGSPSGTIAVSGVTSATLASANLDLYCFYDDNTQVLNGSKLNTAPVSVANQTFSATVSRPEGQPCILRAVPHGIVSNQGVVQDYVGSFTGPEVLYGENETISNAANKQIRYDAVANSALGADSFWDAGEMSGAQLAPVDPATQHLGANGFINPLTLTDNNLTTSGSPTGSQIVVDGHNAYLPFVLNAFADTPSHVPTMTTSFHRKANGDTTIVESDPVDRCTTASEHYPQDALTHQCVPQSAGVTFQRSITTSSGGARVLVLDRFTSTDGKKHFLAVQYGAWLPPAQTSGEPGYELPGQSHFTTVSTPGSIGRLTAGVQTLALTTDVHAVDGREDRTDAGLTYSSAPTTLFSSLSEFGLGYSRSVPAGGWTGFGFGLSTAFSMHDIRSYSAAAAKAFRARLRISSPKSGARVSSPVKVTGTASAGVNGLPASVRISSGKKSVTATVGNTGKFSGRLHLAAGKHTITVAGKDPAGNALSAKVKIRVR